MHVVWVQDDLDQELLQAVHFIAQRPRTERLAHNGHLILVFVVQDGKGLQDTLGGRMLQEIGRNAEIVGAAPGVGYRTGHHVWSSPVDLTAQRRRLLDDAEDGHDTIVAQDVVAADEPLSSDSGEPLGRTRRSLPSTLW